jgi:multiple sugar transport system substrate-binding protein
MNRQQTFRIAVRRFAPFERALAKIWERFVQQTGCLLKLELVPMDLHPLHHALLENGGLRNGDWDVAHIITDWLAEAHEAGALLNLRPYLEENPPENFPEGWTPSLLNYQDFGDAIVGLPFHDGPEVLIYRRDLFEDPAEQRRFRDRYGRLLGVPETWEEFVEVARFFHRPEQKLYGTVFAAFPDGHNTVYDFALATWTHGGELVDELGRVVVDSPGARGGLEFYRSVLQDVSAVHPRCREFDSVQSGFAFAAGEVALMVNWFGFAAMCEVIPESRVKGRVDIAAVPHAPGAPSASLNCYWLYGIGSGSPHPRVAWDFLRFAVNAENDRLLTLEGGIGCRKSTWRDATVNQSVPYYYRLEELHRHARTLPRKANWARLAEVIDQLVLQAIDTDLPVGEILEKAQTEIQRREAA